MAGDPVPEWAKGSWVSMPSPWPCISKREFFALIVLGQLRSQEEYRDARIDDTCDDAVRFADELILSLEGRSDAE